MKKLLPVFLFVLVFSDKSLAQNPIGLPEITNYTKQQYLAGAQNWDIKQGPDGVMYFANNEGLLSFDGSYWKLYALPNKTVVRSIEPGPDGKIYVGAQNEIGFFSPNKKGELIYTSLLPLLPVSERSFADVWNIIFYRGDIFFRSSNKIFRLKGQKFSVYPNYDWRFMGLSNNTLIAQDHSNRILNFQNNSWTSSIDQQVLPEDFLITSIISYKKDSTVITTAKNGIYYLAGNSIQKLESPDLHIISGKYIYKALKVDSTSLLLTTSLGGCYIIDRSGNIIQKFTTSEGLQNNNIRHPFLDKDRNLWLGLDNGIDFLAFDNAIKNIYPDKQNEGGGGYAAIIFDKKLYIGTSNGLFSTALNNNNLSQVKNNFVPVLGSEGQVWNLSEVNGKLLLGHHEGAYAINGNTATAFDNSSGFWNFSLISPATSPVMFAGTYQGINFYSYENGKLVNKGIHSHFESARIVAVDNDDIWVAHPYKGIFKVNYNYGKPVYKSYSERGLISVNHNFIYKVRKKIIVPAGNNFYEYNSSQDAFEPSPFFNKIFNGLDVSYMKEDGAGNIWFISKKSLGVVDFSAAQTKIIYIPELNGKLVSGFEFIYPVNSTNVLVGGEKGFYHINYEQYRNTSNQIKVFIRTVKARDEYDQLIFGGYYGNDAKNNFKAGTTPQLEYKWNSLRFGFSSTLYGQQSNIEYSYFLKGFDRSWSGWVQKTEKEYTNLSPGTYTFMVKARNNLGNESSIAEFRIQILPPWYRSMVAFIFYFLVATALGVFFYRRQKVKFKQQQIKFEEEQKHLQYMHQLELERSEQAIIKLKNDKLETDINHKNKELAAATMHLVQKGELMAKIREELMRLLKNIGDQKSVQEFKRVLRMMSEDEKFEEDWEQFSFHFDRVHGDFLMALKSKFPNITATELKLCAYLRMNLSTKEMAQLMNISVRGVEISRYRLRKKLHIPTEKHLLDYLIEAVNDKKAMVDS